MRITSCFKHSWNQPLFFGLLRQIEKEINHSKASAKTDTKTTKQSPKFAWEETINVIANEFFNGDWNKVVKLNVYKFNYYIKFLEHKYKKQEMEQRKLKRKR